MVKEKKRYYWIDLLKIFACFLVIVNHTGSYLLQYSGTSSCTFNIACYIFVLTIIF